MKTLRVALVAALVAGGNFDKLFNSAAGGGPASRQRAQRTGRRTPQAPLEAAAVDRAAHKVTSFTGPIAGSRRANPGGDPLAPQTVNAVTGGAALSTPRIGQPTSGYSLVGTR